MVSILTHRTSLVVTTLLVTWLVWGSSFVAVAFALESFPPLLLMATRFVVAGAVATCVGVVLARRAGRPLPAARAWRDASIVGFGFIAIGMGVSSWATTRLPTGIAALLVATAPLWIVVIELVRSRGASRDAFALGGVATGIAGVVVLMSPGGTRTSIDAVAALVVVASTAVWAAASIFAQRSTGDGGVLLGVGMQMLSGGVQLAAIALALGEGARLDLDAVSTTSLAGWGFLVIAASLGGFVAYGWLLQNVSAGTAATHAFVNPIVAVALGVAILGEQLDGRMYVAGAAVVVAVVLLLVAESRSSRSIASTPRSTTERHVRGGRVIAIGRSARVTRSSARRSWSPTPTPEFATRRTARPWHATDGMDALSIDEALDELG